eukprot:CAMPEP_0168245206 /NCGR_PEP_ID=MMETSP0140_2-20121125/25041_1 /TAXON_ID=44445 /ORGANISM="Pseudo-nitzschia australis, Strain 10249 10 AB" /LENGTH=199 /DNA_ID=CAMNT_0008180781 /DNA_START=587 /DNA_END=1182 /DNA_ORIENTATION=+
MTIDSFVFISFHTVQVRTVLNRIAAIDTHSKQKYSSSVIRRGKRPNIVPSIVLVAILVVLCKIRRDALRRLAFAFAFAFAFALFVFVHGRLAVPVPLQHQLVPVDPQHAKGSGGRLGLQHGLHDAKVDARGFVAGVPAPVGVPRKGGHHHVGILPQDVEHPVVVPDQADRVGGFRVDGLVGEDDHFLVVAVVAVVVVVV